MVTLIIFLFQANVVMWPEQFWGHGRGSIPWRLCSLRWRSRLLTHLHQFPFPDFFSCFSLCSLRSMGPELFVTAPLPTCFPMPAPWLSLCLRPRMPFPQLCRPKDYSPSGPDSNIIFFSVLCDIHPYLAVTSPSSELPGCFFLFLIMFYLISSPTSISLRAGAMSRFCVLHCPQHSHFCNELIMFPGHTHSQVISSGQERGSVRKLQLIRVHKATFLFPKTWGRCGVTYGTGNQDQCLQDTTCPAKGPEHKLNSPFSLQMFSCWVAKSPKQPNSWVLYKPLPFPTFTNVLFQNPVQIKSL